MLAEKRKGSDEENFDEAVMLFRRAGTKSGVSAQSALEHGAEMLTCTYQIPEDIKILFDDECCQSVNAEVRDLEDVIRSHALTSGRSTVFQLLALAPSSLRLHTASL